MPPGLMQFFSGVVAGFLDILAESIQYLLLEPLAPGTTSWERALYGNGWGAAEVISVVVTFVLLAVSVVWHKNIGKALQALLVCFVLVVVGGGIFFRFFDGVQAFSRTFSTWMIQAGGEEIRFDTPDSGDAAAIVLGLTGISGAGAILIVMMLVLSMALIVCKTVFLPLLVLTTTGIKWAKWLFDWVVSIMVVGLLLGGPMVVGIILLGRVVRHTLGDKNPFLGVMVLVAACVIAIVVLIVLMRAAHRTISEQTGKLQAAVNGMVETKVTNRPHVNLAQAHTNYVNAVLPTTSNGQPNRPRPGVINRTYHEGSAAALSSLTAKLASRPHPVAAATTVAATALTNHHKSKAKR